GERHGEDHRRLGPAGPFGDRAAVDRDGREVVVDDGGRRDALAGGDGGPAAGVADLHGERLVPLDDPVADDGDGDRSGQRVGGEEQLGAHDAAEVGAAGGGAVDRAEIDEGVLGAGAVGVAAAGDVDLEDGLVAEAAVALGHVGRQGGDGQDRPVPVDDG